MFGTMKIGRALGIDVFVHGTFWLLPLLVLFGGLGGDRPGDVALDLAVLFTIFGCVALHELGHAVAAGWYGIRTRDITLYPIGGVARLENLPSGAWPEIVVALAGPAVNVAIAFGLGVLLAAGGATEASLAEPTAGMAFLDRVLVANVVLVLFNLIPAFPMDGGRVLRAALHLFTDRVRATEAAANVGAVAAAGLFAFGLAAVNPMLCVLAVMVFLMGRAELFQVRYLDDERRRAARAAAGEYTVGPWSEVPVDPPARPRVVVAKPIDGWEWDAVRQVWTEYRDGYPVRRWPSAG